MSTEAQTTQQDAELDEAGGDAVEVAESPAIDESRPLSLAEVATLAAQQKQSASGAEKANKAGTPDKDSPGRAATTGDGRGAQRGPLTADDERRIFEQVTGKTAASAEAPTAKTPETTTPKNVKQADPKAEPKGPQVPEAKPKVVGDTPEQRERFVKDRRALELEGWKPAELAALTPERLHELGSKARERTRAYHADKQREAEARKATGRPDADQAQNPSGRSAAERRATSDESEDTDALDALLNELDPGSDDEPRAARDEAADENQTNGIGETETRAIKAVVNLTVKHEMAALEKDSPDVAAALKANPKLFDSVMAQMARLDDDAAIARSLDDGKMGKLFRDALDVVFAESNRTRAGRVAANRNLLKGQPDHPSDAPQQQPTKPISRAEYERIAYDVTQEFAGKPQAEINAEVTRRTAGRKITK